MLVMFLFFQRVISEIPRPITVKLCHMLGNLSYFIMQLPKFGGHSPKKILGAKNMQNFGPFCTTSNFDREYLRNGSTYQKSEKLLIMYNPCHVKGEKNLAYCGPQMTKLLTVNLLESITFSCI